MHQRTGDRATGAQGDERSAISDHAQQVACPFCDSTETELLSLFGQFLLASPYYCRNCHSVFDRVRWDEEAPREAPPMAESE